MSNSAPVDWVPVSNASGELIPAGGLMRITGVSTDGLFTVGKPNAASDRKCLVNDLADIAIGAKGQGTCDPRVILAYTGSAPTAGAELGSVSGSWSAQTGQTGFIALTAGTGSFLNALRAAVPVAPPLLGKITAGPTSGVYTVRRQKRNTSTNAIDDYSPTTDFTSVVSAESLTSGDYVELWQIDGDPSSYYTAHKIGPASPGAIARLSMTGSSAGTDSVTSASVTGLTAAVSGWTPASGQVAAWWQQGATKYVFPMAFASGSSPGFVSMTTQTLGAGTKRVDALISDDTITAATSVTSPAMVGTNYTASGVGGGTANTVWSSLTGWDGTISAARAVGVGCAATPGLVVLTSTTVDISTGVATGSGTSLGLYAAFSGASNSPAIRFHAAGNTGTFYFDGTNWVLDSTYALSCKLTGANGTKAGIGTANGGIVGTFSPPVVVTGSKASGAALASLLSALANSPLSLITDSTTT